MTSLRGLSRSPVYAFDIEGNQIRYTVVGIQSGWYPGHDLVTFCVLFGFLERLKA